jgi:hypothetical protein
MKDRIDSAGLQPCTGLLVVIAWLKIKIGNETFDTKMKNRRLR